MEVGILVPRSNIANKVRNTHLPKTKALLPLFEVISNSIHAINEARKQRLLTGKGKIQIKVIRVGHSDALFESSNIDIYPVRSFQIKDNGIGLNDENLACFAETDTDHKIEIGGKGVGRFVCLKAFNEIQVKSCYDNDGVKLVREFTFKATKEGFHDFKETPANITEKVGTTVTLENFREDYRSHIPLEFEEIARSIILHFQLYFITGEMPDITIASQNSKTIDLKKLFALEFAGEIKSREFNIQEFKFTLYLTKSYKAQSHKLHFCAHNRTVKEEYLYNRIIDLGSNPLLEGGKTFYYQAFVVSELLDDNVDVGRVGFNFPSGEEEEESTDEISLSLIRKEAIKAIEILLFDYLKKVRDEKIEKYRPTVYNDMPQYRYVFNKKIEEVKRLPPNLSKPKLDIELYKIESSLKLEVKEELDRLNQGRKDETLDEYKAKYDTFLTEFNEIGQADLARYVVHRKSVIDLLEDLISKDDQDKFSNEDLIHSLFFPMRTTSDDIPHEAQNLWLLDEKLTYHSYLASDKQLKALDPLDVDSNNRTDLIIFNNALAFSEEKYSPFASITIVEFKKPQRDNYRDYDSSKNPLDQAEMYVDDLLSGKIKDRGGRQLKIDSATPFYIYIVCDISDSFEAILKKREFNRTPDGEGYYYFKNKYYNAFIEVIPFHKVLTDAKKRNRVLFDKLGIDSSR